MAGRDRWTQGTDTRAPYILSALFVCSDLVLLGGALAYPGVSGWRSLFWVPPVAMAALWPFLHWNHRAAPWRKALSLLFMLAALAAMAVGSGLTTLPLMAVTIVHAVSVSGFSGGIAFSVATIVSTLVVGLLFRESGQVGQSVIEAVVVAMFALWALLTARVLLRARQRARETERLLDELTHTHAELRRYAARVRELTVSEERARMSREMHDSVGHHLTVINLGLENAQRYRRIRPDDAWAEVRQAQRLTTEALAETRRWVRALKPLALEGRAGPAAMAELARSFGGTGMDVSFRLVGEEFHLDEEGELALYRVLQEGLTNAVRHSGARHVEVVLASARDQVELSITDDGRGDDLPGDGPPAGGGLAGLRHRLAALGGTLRAETGPAGGFVLRVSLPARAEASA